MLLQRFWCGNRPRRGARVRAAGTMQRLRRCAAVVGCRRGFTTAAPSPRVPPAPGS
ncbi:hypothetical protein FM125_03815 [Micrococcus lylae]|uniref:Uncharacterized protein n=1 Tax=Micrococcus lylae TaxID=1273 RepID=A0A1R4IPN9_9MICC|nr:hypothetical protein FM125_03815 [Micrococcus lylae]